MDDGPTVEAMAFGGSRYVHVGVCVHRAGVEKFKLINPRALYPNTEDTHHQPKNLQRDACSQRGFQEWHEKAWVPSGAWTGPWRRNAERLCNVYMFIQERPGPSR